MLNTVLRFIGLLEKFGFVKKLVKITYTGQGITLNDIYGLHYQARGSKVRKYKETFTWLLKQSGLQRFDKFALLLAYNSRMDTDNVSGMAKMFVDALHDETKNGITIRKGWVENDNHHFYKALITLPAKSLPFNTYDFYIIIL